jgi:beta-lactamase regulating signal transducer with metallopeptidase domain
MNWLTVQTVAQISVERILNALPEGFLIALFAWGLLRVLRRQNAGTRFAVWFFALLAVAILPVVADLGAGRARTLGVASLMSSRPAITIPEGWAVFVFLLWAVGAGFAIARLGFGLFRLRKLRRSCTAVSLSELDPQVRKTVEDISALGSVTVATSDALRVPAAIGYGTQTIVLPAWTLRELPPADLNAILLHESAHLRRGDDWTNLVQKMVRAVFFFHPAVWWIERQLSVEREMACDDAVLAETANPRGYAACLVSLLEKSLAHREMSLAQAAVRRAREATLRLTKILDQNRPSATRVWKPALGMVGAFSLVCWLALPHAPQLVAVDHGIDPVMTASVSNSPGAFVPSAVVSQQTAMTIPTAFHEKLKQKALSRSTRIAQPAPTQTVAGKSPEPKTEGSLVTEVNANQDLVPQFQTLVFIEATPYGSLGSPVWRMQIWRVTVFSGVRERIARVPVANSI